MINSKLPKLKLNNKGQYRNGKTEGTCVDYYKNGQLWFEVEHKNGLQSGSYISYYENGQLDCKGNNEIDRRDGEWFCYHENGNIRKETAGTYKFGKKISD